MLLKTYPEFPDKKCTQNTIKFPPISSTKNKIVTSIPHPILQLQYFMFLILKIHFIGIHKVVKNFGSHRNGRLTFRAAGIPSISNVLHEFIALPYSGKDKTPLRMTNPYISKHCAAMTCHTDIQKIVEFFAMCFMLLKHKLLNSQKIHKK